MSGEKGGYRPPSEEGNEKPKTEADRELEGFAAELQKTPAEISFKLREKIQKEAEKEFNKEVQKIFPLYAKKEGSYVLILETPEGVKYFMPSCSSRFHYNYWPRDAKEYFISQPPIDNDKRTLWVSDDLIRSKGWRGLVKHVLSIPTNLHVAAYNKEGKYDGQETKTSNLETIIGILLELKSRGAKIIEREKKLDEAGFKVGDMVTYRDNPDIIFKILAVQTFPDDIERLGSPYTIILEQQGEAKNVHMEQMEPYGINRFKMTIENARDVLKKTKRFRLF